VTVQCQYTVMRFVPNMLRNECVNVGVVLQALDRPFIKARFTGRLARIRSLWPTADRTIVEVAQKEFRRRFRTYEHETDAQLELIVSDPGPAVTAGDFLSHLHREYENNIQFSPPAPTVAQDSLEEELEELYRTYVAEEEPFVWRSPAVKLSPAGQREKVVRRLRRDGFVGRGRLREDIGLRGASHYGWVFDLGRVDEGVIVQTLSLDTGDPQSKVQRSLILTGMIRDVANITDVTSTAIVFPPSGNGSRRAGYDEALSILKREGVRSVEVSDSVDAAVKIAERWLQKAQLHPTASR
jgi:hypothetical protein